MLRCLVVYLPGLCLQNLQHTNTVLHKYYIYKACTNTAEILHKSCTDSGGKSAAHKYHNTSPLHHNLPNSGKTASARAQKRLLGIIRIHSDVLKFLLSVHQEGHRSIHIYIRSCIIHTPWTSSKHMQNKPWSFPPIIWTKCPLTWPYFCW